MRDCTTNQATVCDSRFRDVFHRMQEMQEDAERLDEAIRGNGKPGLNQRVATLEQAETRRGRIMWIVIGAIATVVIPAALKILIAGIQ